MQCTIPRRFREIRPRCRAGLAGRLAVLAVAFGLTACGRVDLPGVAVPGIGGAATREMVVDRVWLAEDADAAPGSFLVFVSDGTLVMDSCGETWRMAPWRWVDGGTLVWEEDAATLRAEVAVVGRRELVLVLEPDGMNLTRSYRAAEAPMLCPGG